MAKDKDIQSTGFENRSDDFQQNLLLREEIYELIKNTLISETEKNFKLKGILPSENYAGVYSNGKNYGKGSEDGKYNVTYSNTTKTQINKTITYGAKKFIAELAIIFDPKNNLLKLSYKGTSGAVFRGHEDIKDSSGFLLNDKLIINTKNKKKLKEELTNFFKLESKKEVNYLLSTKINVEDKFDTSLQDALVQENKHTNMRLNNLLNISEHEIVDFFNEKIQESNEKLTKFDKNSKTIKQKNISDIENSDKKLLFDDLDEGINSKEALSKFDVFDLDELEYKMYKDFIKNSSKEEALQILINNVEGDYSQLSPKLARIAKKQDKELDETTMSGTMSVGAGGYLTPKAFKETNFFKNKEKRPVIKKTKNEEDTFWTKVEMEKGGWPPKGMSKDFVMGQHNLNEAVLKNNHKIDTTRKKFFDESENKDLGVNKRYLITDQLNESEQFNKWRKLATHNLFETVKKAEDVISKEEMDLLKECGCQNNNQYIDQKLIDGDSVEDYLNDEFEDVNSEFEDDLITVSKGKDSFVIYKVDKNEFINENKKYIFDYITKEYVVNPNYINK